MEVSKESFVVFVDGLEETHTISFAIQHKINHQEIINIINHLSSDKLIHFRKMGRVYYFGNSGIELLKNMI